MSNTNDDEVDDVLPLPNLICKSDDSLYDITELEKILLPLDKDHVCLSKSKQF
jgi:hypothetical protein